MTEPTLYTARARNAVVNYDPDVWSTPRAIIYAARELMGHIDIDPASNDFAQTYVQAGMYYTKDTDGLAHEWRGNLWLNPPYSKTGAWVTKLFNELPNIDRGVVLVNSYTDTAWFRQLAETFPVLFTRGRLQFEHPARSGDRNRMGQALFNIRNDTDRFVKVFEPWFYPVNKWGVFYGS